MPDKIHTYVLIGESQEDKYTIYAERQDCHVILVKPGESIEDAVKKIKQFPANVILQCHGESNGTFLWHEKEWLPYTRLFEALPKSGIQSLTLGSCYGGTAEELLSAAPPGMILQTMIGAKTPAPAGVTQKFAHETAGLTKPIDLYLEALDNFNPARYQEFMTYLNKRDGTHIDTDPEDAMPHIIGIGGKPPQQIDLQHEMASLREKDASPAFQEAVLRVQRRFDTDNVRSAVNAQGQTDPSSPADGPLGAADQKQLNADIAAVAQKLVNGDELCTIEEKRLAYAITAAYLDESGELKRRIEAIPGYAPVASLDANGKPIALTQPTQSAISPPPSSGPITGEEQAYLDSVRKKLACNPKLKSQVDAIIAQLTETFSQTSGNDLLNENLVKTLQQADISTKSWER